MARSKNQFLQNVHTREEYSLAKIAEAQLKDGEIAVFQNADKPSLGIKVGETTYAQFKDSKAVTAEINSAKTELSTTISANATKIGELETKFDGYATTGALATAKTELTEDYDGKFTAIKGEGYTSGTTLKSLSDAIDSLKSGSDTSVAGLATRVTTAERKITDLEDKVGDDTKGLVKDVADLKTTVGDSTSGLVKDVADLKTKDTDLNTKIDAVSGASSAYTDSQINAIKGDSYKTGTTLASLESNLGTEKLRIDAILKDAPTGLTSFKDVETKITNAITNAITAAYKYQGSVDNYSDLPENVTTIGFVYNVKNAVGNIGDKNYTPAGTNYAWNGTEWDALGGTIDLSTYVNDALTGVTGTGSTSIVTRLTTAETKITNLQQSASTLNTDVQAIKGWKINDKFISGSPILNGTDINVDDTPGAQTLKDAIASAKTAGDNAMNYAEGVSGSVKTLNDTVDKNKAAIDAYTVNGLKISEKPVLTGDNVKVSTATTAQTLNVAIAEAEKAGTTAQTNLTTLKGSYSGTLDTLSDKVDANEQSINTIDEKLTTASSRANSAIQRITIKANADAGVKISDPTGGDGTKTQELDFSAIVIDCGEF